MKSKIATFIISIIIILIVSVLGIFGMIIFQEIQDMATSIEPENFETTISDNDTIDQDITIPKILENPFEKIRDRNNDNSNVDYSNVNVDKYFYNQLDDYSKMIYKAFESNKENMKTGTYAVELGNSFSELLNKEGGQDLLGRYYQSAIEAYIYDNPDIIYLSPNKLYLNIETTTRGNKTTYNVYIDNGNDSNYLTDEFSSKDEVDMAISKLEGVKNNILQKATGNTYNDIKMVHDYLIDNIEYDTTISRPNIYNAYGALINRNAVCEGYARAFKYLMDSMGINCTLAIGKASNSEGRTENHAWNYVEIDGNWYAIDCTWDDPVTSGGGWVSQSSKYKYFLKGANEIGRDHVANGQFTEGGKIFRYPTLNNNNYR